MRDLPSIIDLFAYDWMKAQALRIIIGPRFAEYTHHALDLFVEQPPAGSHWLLPPATWGSMKFRGYVDGVPLQHVDRDEREHRLVGSGEHDVRGVAGVVRPGPVDGGDAPPVPRVQPREAVERHRRRQVVADAALVLEEVGRHDRADRVAAEVLRAG